MNYKIVIDAGHGGKDYGIIDDKVIEKDYTLKISQYMKKRFDEMGVDASLIRDKDITLTPSERSSLAKRFYGNGKDVVLISNHLNSKVGSGFEIIYSLRNDDMLSRLISEEVIKGDRSVRKYYQKGLPGDVLKDYYDIMRNANDQEVVLVEYDFLNDDKNDNRGKNWKDDVDAVVKGIMKYINKSYSEKYTEDLDDYYIVLSGDSLWSIAKKFNVSIDEIKRINNIKSNLLTIGEKIKIPKDILVDKNEFYVVKKGDTLYGLANKFGLSTQDIIDANGLMTTVLSVGQSLVIPNKGYSDLDDSNIGMEIYIVVKGDTLYNLATRYNVRVQDIIKINKLESTALFIGQKLYIPNSKSKVEDDIRYVVKKEDSLYQIAKAYNTTVDSIMKFNNLESDKLTVGQILLFPSQK